MSDAGISVCGVVEYPCYGTCGDWVKEHDAIWIRSDGTVHVTGGRPFCPTCAQGRRGR